MIGPTCLGPDAFYHLASAALTQGQDVGLAVTAAPLPAMVSVAAEPQSELDCAALPALLPVLQALRAARFAEAGLARRADMSLAALLPGGHFLPAAQLADSTLTGDLAGLVLISDPSDWVPAGSPPVDYSVAPPLCDHSLLAVETHDLVLIPDSRYAGSHADFPAEPRSQSRALLGAPV